MSSGMNDKYNFISVVDTYIENMKKEKNDNVLMDTPDGDLRMQTFDPPGNIKPVYISESKTSQRHNQGKIQVKEIDPNFIMAMAEVLTKSRVKYDAFNWQKPTKLSTPYESLFRHLMAFQQGENIDPEDGTSHLAKIAINAMFMYYHLSRNEEYSDDRAFKKK